MRRFLTWLGLVVLALILLVLMLLSFLLNTEWGARVALDQAAGFVPGKLEVAEVEGTLAGPLTVRGIDYANQGLRVGAQRLRLDLDIKALLVGTARVEFLSVQDATVHLPPPDEGPQPEPEPEEPFQLPEINLPAAIEVAALQVHNVRIVPSGGGALVIESMALSAAFEAGELTVEELKLDTSAGYLRLAGSVDTVDAYATDLKARFGWRREDALIEGRIAAEGDLNLMRMQTRVGPPVRLKLTARLEDILKDLGFSADVRLAGFEAKAFGMDALPGPVEAELEITGGRDAIHLHGAVASAERRFAIEALQVGFKENRIVLDTLRVQGEGATRFAASGTVGLSGEQPVLNVHAQWRALSIPLAPGEVIRSPMGGISVAGTLDDYRAEAQLRVAGAVPKGRWQVRGHGSLEAFTLEALTARTLEGTLQAAGRVSWRPALQWQLQLDARQINPGVLAPEWPGHVTLALQTQGTLTDNGPRGRLQLEELTGELRGRPVDAGADIRLDGLTDVEGELYVSSADSEISAEGRYGEPTDLRVTLDIPQLRDLYPGASGRVQGALTLTGSPGRLRLAGTLQGGKLRYAGSQVGELQTRFDVAQAKAARSELHLTAHAVHVAGRTVAGLNFDLTGTRADHSMTLTAHGPAGEIQLAVSGGLRDQRWEGLIRQLQLAATRAGRWQLRDPAGLQLGSAFVELNQSCLVRAGGAERREAATGVAPRGVLCVAMHWQSQRGVNADLTVDQLPLAAADAFMGQALTAAHLEGSLNGEVHLDTTPGQAPRLAAHLTTQGAALVFTHENGARRLTFNPLTVDASLAQGELGAQLNLVIEELGRVTAQLRSPSFNLDNPEQSPLRGALTIDINTLQPIAPLIGPLMDTDGQIAGRITLDGTLAAVRLGGDLRLSNFNTRIPAAGLHLTDGRLILSADGQRLQFEGEVSSGEGQIALDGEAFFPEAAPVQVRAEINGERFLAADLPGVHVVITPNLDAAVAGDRVEVTGTVKIPEATIKLGQIQGGGPEAVGTSPDVVIVGMEKEKREPAIKLFAEIDVILGDDIEITGRGFEGGADGRLHVSVAPGQPALGSGQLQIAGTYQAYGQDLTITEGRILYSDSPLGNPGLQIAAVRVVEDVTAGVRITGTAKQPRIELFSNPPLGSDAQILSYIVLGKPLDEAGGGEGLNLRRKATVKGAGLLAKQIGAKLGLENVAVEETAAGVSVVSVGRYLSPRLYISYGMGILEPVTVVKLEYELSDLWTLEATAGVETRAGIRFDYEN